MRSRLTDVELQAYLLTPDVHPDARAMALELVQRRGTQADRYARTHSQDKGAPPHYLRCNFVDNDFRRCLKGNGHGEGHEFPKPAAD